MKDEGEILYRASELRAELSEAEKKYKALDQVDLLSCTGNNLRELINYLKGGLAALGWVVYKEFKAKESNDSQIRP